MRIPAAKMGVALIAAAISAGAGSLAVATAANADVHHHVATSSVRPDSGVWVVYHDYATYEQCKDEGRSLLGGGVVIDYRCDYDSPGWALSVRIE